MGLEAQRIISPGLGDAVERFMYLYLALRGIPSAQRPGELIAEYDMLKEALNAAHTLRMGFDCDNDGMPDTLEIFQARSKSKDDCCRLVWDDTEPATTTRPAKKGKKPRGRLV